MDEAVNAEIWGFRFEGVWILVVRGDLDIDLSRDLRHRLERALESSPVTILVDLEEASLIGSSALGALIAARARAKAQGADLRLVAPSAPVRRVLRLSETSDLFPIEPDLSAASAAVHGESADPRVSGFDDAA